MSKLTTKRRMVFLRLVENHACLADDIRAAGWDVYVATSFSSALAFCSRYEIKVGLVLAGGAQGEAQREKTESVANSHYGIRWVALLPAGSLRCDTLRALIGDCFYDYHTLPVDRSRLLTTLGHALGMAELMTLRCDCKLLPRGIRDHANKSLAGARHAAEKEAIEYALRLAQNNLSETARRLEISRPTLYRLLKKHRLIDMIVRRV